ILVKHYPVIVQVIHGQVLLGDIPHLVQEPAKDLGVLRLFEEEGGQIHLLFQPSLVGNHLDQGEQIPGDRFLAGLKHGAQAQGHFLFHIIEFFPVLFVLGQIDVLRIPNSQLFGLVIKTHGQKGVIQAPLAGGQLAHGSSSPFISGLRESPYPLSAHPPTDIWPPSHNRTGWTYPLSPASACRASVSKWAPASAQRSTSACRDRHWPHPGPFPDPPPSPPGPRGTP